MPCLACILLNVAQATCSSSESLGILQNRQSTNSLLGIAEGWSNLRLKCVPSKRFIVIVKTLTMHQPMWAVVLIYFVYSTVPIPKKMRCKIIITFLGKFRGRYAYIRVKWGSGSFLVKWGKFYRIFLKPWKARFSGLKKNAKTFSPFWHGMTRIPIWHGCRHTDHEISQEM